MEFYNRHEEIKRLKTALEASQPRLIVVYGRRRIGKTRMLQQVVKEGDIYFIADQRETKLQIASFARLVATKIESFDKVTYPDWEIFFRSINQRIKKGTTLFIDEFPYLVKNASELPSILQKLIDEKEKLNFHLVLSGSSQQMMQKMVIDHHSPLYGRANEIIKLTSMRPGWLKKALNCSYVEAVEEFSIWGGVPRYWEIRNDSASMEEAIKKQVFNIHGILHEEPMRLFLDDTRDTVQIHTLISIIATGANRLSEIASRIGKPTTQLSRPLQKIIELGYIKREIPYGVSKRNSKKTLYKVSEPFMLFYYRFIVPEKTTLELGYVDQVYKQIFEKQFSSHCADIWENMCRQALPNLFTNSLFKPGVRWWGNNTEREQMEIDIVANSSDDRELIIGEAKRSSTRNISAIIKELEKKAKTFPLVRNQRIILALFVKQNTLKETPDNVFIFTPEDVVKALS
ncbi:putative ATPase (AAA+ superfamily) [Salinivirga cyanobacteriivorans]|uniref:Putative ATPase (AAA+ superfamily) n=1 Tax=Salinivirga cyanobacteriivorans TaxID=1307839 RepID=A0A0S2I0M6_9BACT|nr:ATP-binding protein [Salinivirga cyanobacteriivorans]ALO15787.1 putative ATPase (AAA+ superfamily) [Salinivirga cyanobacteriivorans]